MPLYMDFHRIDADAFTEEDMYRAHLRDVAIQNKHGLVYKRYYLDLHQKTAFCLMEGPNERACIENHLEAHGVGACNVIEVSREHEFLPFLGEGSQNERDVALTLSGELDSGFRTLMLVDCLSVAGDGEKLDNLISKAIQKHKGTIISLPSRQIMASFVDASDAVSCALGVQVHFESSDQLFHGTALATGKPVDEHGKALFAETREKARILSMLGNPLGIAMDLETKLAATRGQGAPTQPGRKVKVFDQAAYRELQNVERILSKNMDNPGFTVGSFTLALGSSRSQAYRRIRSLTGMSPKQLLSDLRLVHAIKALKQGNGNISEIAYGSGFNSPTYFTRVFRKRFGTLPSAIVPYRWTNAAPMSD